MSPLLSTGLLMNVVALCISDVVSLPIHITVQVLAILIMLVGLYQTARGRERE